MKQVIKIIILICINLGVFVNGDDISVLSKTKINNNWEIFYKVNIKKDINKTNIIYNNKLVDITRLSYPNNKLSTAIMFLVDTSVPMRKAWNKGIKSTIKDIFDTKQIWDKWAIAGFSDKMTIFGEYNQSNEIQALNSMRIGGQRTELFRASLEAMESLKTIQAKRKFLFIFSDGEAEDNAYTYQEVISKAKELNIEIVSFGYKDSIHLQSLRRMSEESKGVLYIANKKTHQFPLGYIDDLKHIMNNHSLITFKSNVLKANDLGYTNVDLKVLFKDNNSSSKNIKLETKTKKSFLLYYIIAGVIALIILFFIFKPKKQIEEEVEEIEEEVNPIAYFKTPSGTKNYIYNTYNSIGALPENDIVIEGEYISRHHATLNFKDDKFYLTDSNSANKVFINYKEISTGLLKDGDMVSFGPYEVSFYIIKE